MRLLTPFTILTSWFWIALSFLSIAHAFRLAGLRKDEQALAFIERARFRALAAHPTMVLSLEHALLKAYLQMKLDDLSIPVGFLSITCTRR